MFITNLRKKYILLRNIYIKGGFFAFTVEEWKIPGPSPEREGVRMPILLEGGEGGGKTAPKP